jgi:hypothetical protein
VDWQQLDSSRDRGVGVKDPSQLRFLSDESVIVGSNATARTYEDKNFKGTELALLPGQRVQNLGKLDMANDIESIKIACGK